MQMQGSNNRVISRLKKELEELEKHDNYTVKVNENDCKLWTISFSGAEDTLYAGEKFTLEFRFTDDYPFESPAVKFIGNIPMHSHVYSSGCICLSTLYDDWTPALNSLAVCLSILSMLSSAMKKERPVNDHGSIQRHKNGPKSLRWIFEDLNC